MPFRLGLPRTYWFDRALLALLIAGTAWLSLTLARGPGELAAIWVGNGILTGWLLSRRTATWPVYLAVAFAAELPARILAGDAWGYASAIALCNLLEALGVAALVRRRVPDVRNPKDWLALGGIATAATLASCAAAGVLAAAVSHFHHGQPFAEQWGQWFAAHVVGMVILATATLVVQRRMQGPLITAGAHRTLAFDMGAGGGGGRRRVPHPVPAAVPQLSAAAVAGGAPGLRGGGAGSDRAGPDRRHRDQPGLRAAGVAGAGR